jgi:hypothetical protein
MNSKGCLQRVVFDRTNAPALSKVSAQEDRDMTSCNCSNRSYSAD